VSPAGHTHPPRALLVNGVGLAARAVADLMRTAWRVRTLSVAGLDLLIERGAYQPAGPEDTQVQRHMLVQVVSTLAHAYPPLVVMAATITDDAEVGFVAEGLHGRGVDVAHVVVRMTEDDVHARVHQEGGDPDARRQALQYARRAALEVDGLLADAKVDVTGRVGADVLSDMGRVLLQRGWLDESGAWTCVNGQAGGGG
jgi:hypothetical protein